MARKKIKETQQEILKQSIAPNTSSTKSDNNYHDDSDDQTDDDEDDDNHATGDRKGNGNAKKPKFKRSMKRKPSRA